MAIIIEERKNNINWFATAVVLMIVILVAVTVFYLFFVNPSSMDIIISDNLKIAKEISNANLLKPSEILSSQNFSGLEQHIAPVVAEPAFNPNPF